MRSFLLSNLGARFKGYLSRYATVSLVLIGSFWAALKLLDYYQSASQEPQLAADPRELMVLTTGADQSDLGWPDARCAWSFLLLLSLPLALALLSNLVQESRADAVPRLCDSATRIGGVSHAGI
jgi:hypothetical protein